jgi:hippurate hydrolase
MISAEILFKQAQEQQDKLVTIRRRLHQNPETGFALSNTLAAVQSELKAMGYDPQPCGRAGLTALAGKKAGEPTDGKVFLLRSDMDALPITEESGVPFASSNGNMHACGHDMHTAMLLGAARLLKMHEDEIEGTVKLMFQPSEETFEGSHDMILSGVLKNPDVDAALMIHVTAAMPFTPGTIIVSSGGVSAPAADYFTIKIQGKGCHGSMPHTGIDPVTAAAHIITGLQEIQTRELALGDEAVLTFGKIHGGTAENAIPDTVELGGTLRTYDEEVRAQIKTRMAEISSGIANAFRCQAEVSFGSGCPSLKNDPELSNDVEGYLKELLGSRNVFTTAGLAALAGSGKRPKGGGSEDFAYVSQEVPSLMLALAAGQPEQGYSYPQHHPKVKFDEQVLAVGSAVHAYAALRWLEEHAKGAL